MLPGQTVEVGGDVADLRADLHYMSPETKVARLYVAPGEHLRTTIDQAHTVTIRNVRPVRDQFVLDSAGFTVVDHVSAVTDFDDTDQLRSVYIPEVCAQVKQLTGADIVVPYGPEGVSWTIRSTTPEASGGQPTGSNVHVDLHAGFEAEVFDLAYSALGESKPYRRALMTSFWRTFTEPPQDQPLAVCDFRSITDDDGVPVPGIMIDRIPESIPEVETRGQVFTTGTEFVFNPCHQWWYLPSMTRDEALLFKLNDTDHSVAWRAPHSAFEDTVTVGTHPRRSIEVRTIAFYL